MDSLWSHDKFLRVSHPLPVIPVSGPPVHASGAVREHVDELSSEQLHKLPETEKFPAKDF